MKASMKGQALLACLAVSGMVASGCTGDTGGTTPTPTTGTVTLNLTRHGKPVGGMQVVLQDSATNAEIGSGLSDSAGKIKTTDFSGTARATLVDGNTTQNFLFTLEGLKPSTSLDVELPLLTPEKVGTAKFTLPPALVGAAFYNFMVLGGNSEHTTTLYVPYAAGSPQTVDVYEDAVLSNGKITIVAVAMNSATPPAPIAYSVLPNSAFAATGATPSTLTFPTWQDASLLTDVSLRIPSFPAGIVPTGSTTNIRQFTQGTFFNVNPLVSPASLAAAPLDFGLKIIPGVSDEYSVTATLEDSAKKSIYAMIRKTSSLPSLTSWNPTAAGLPEVSGVQIDTLAPAATPRIKFTTAASLVGKVDMAQIVTSWTSAGKYFAWYSLTSADAVSTGSYQFPALPAAYSAYVPPAGVVFGFEFVLFGKFSNLSGYDSFLKEMNLKALVLKLPQGENVELDLVGSQGT
jgi:hypothetical protein